MTMASRTASSTPSEARYELALMRSWPALSLVLPSSPPELLNANRNLSPAGRWPAGPSQQPP